MIVHCPNKHLILKKEGIVLYRMNKINTVDARYTDHSYNDPIALAVEKFLPGESPFTLMLK